MKRNLYTHLVLSILALFALIICIENSTKTKVYIVNLGQKNIQKITPEIVATDKDEKSIMGDLDALKDKKPQQIPRVEPAKIITNIPNNDYTPRENKVSKTVAKTSVETRIKFLKMNKNLKITKIKISKKEFEVKKLKNEQIKNSINLELSYKDLEIENDYSDIKISKYAWTELAVDPTKYKNLNIAKIDNKIERISKTEKSKMINKEVKASPLPDEEFVFFDYSKSAVEEEKVLVETPQVKPPKVKTPKKSSDIPEISNENIKVNNIVMSSAVDSLKPVELNPVVVSAPKVRKDAQSTIKDLTVDNVKTRLAANEKQESLVPAKNNNTNNAFLGSEAMVAQKDYACLDESTKKLSQYEAKMSIHMRSIDRSQKELRNFEVRFQDNIDDIRQDYGTGKIELNHTLVGKINTRRATFFASGHYPTTTDIVMEAGEISANYPALTREYFEDILSTQKLRGIGSHILVELDDRTEDVDLDLNNRYEAKLYLNKDVRVINRNDSDYRYILFIGVDAGNILINFKDINNNIVSKIVHASSEEIYYEPNFYAQTSTEKVNLYSETLLSKCKSILDVPKEKITTWNSSNIEISKDKLNSYKINKGAYALGSRKYMKLDHLGESIFIGRWEQNNLVLPTEDYISHILGVFNARGGECLVQLNLSKDITSFNLNGISKANAMRVEVSLLDDDGKFYDSIGEKTKKIFISGQEQGVINLEINYADNSSQYLQTYCSENTYLIEQL